MSEEISIEDLPKAIYDAYRLGVEEIHESVLIAADECATACVESLREDSPKSKKNSKSSTSYAKGWVKRKTKNGSYVYNKNKPYLEMPLEHGHLITRGKKKGQRVPAKPHIYKNVEKYQERFFDMCSKIVSEGVRFSKEK